MHKPETDNKTNGTMERIILRPKDVVQMTGLSRTQIWRLEVNGDFPIRKRLGARATGWFREDIERWLSERPDFVSTKKPTPAGDE